MSKPIRIGFIGDVMIGRLVNEKLRQVNPEYIFGTVLPLMQNCDAVIANLEAALTHSESAVTKVFNFKSDPAHVKCLKIANIQAVNLANNHVLDYSQKGLLETLNTLEKAGITYVGAGKNSHEAKEIKVLHVRDCKIALLGYTDNEPGWIATENRPGTNFITIGTDIASDIAAAKKAADIVIVSLHWGPNMVERPPETFIRFAHHLIDQGVDVIHGHSAHIFQGVEVYKNRYILYDCGDFVDDYYVDPFLRNDRSFFFELELTGSKPIKLTMRPVLIQDCQVNLANDQDQQETLDRMKALSLSLGTYLVEDIGTLIARCD